MAITVEKVVNKNADKEQEKFRNAGTQLPGTPVSEIQKKSYLPWILLGLAAIGAAWYFLIRKKDGGKGNEGVSN